MTCIVGLVHNGKVYMGGDSECCDGSARYSLTEPKVFLKQGFLIGSTGQLRLMQLLQYTLVVRERNTSESDMEYLVNGFASAVRNLLKDNGYSEVNMNREDFFGSILVGYRGNVYEIDPAFAVMHTSNAFHAVGSGYAFALGAMAAMPDEFTPHQKITRVLEIASEFAMGVRAPFHIISDS